jgi:hypothetical protein
VRSLDFSLAEVREIGDAAFYGCTRLQRVLLPLSVVALGELMSEGCFVLKSSEMGSPARHSIPHADRWGLLSRRGKDVAGHTLLSLRTIPFRGGEPVRLLHFDPTSL